MADKTAEQREEDLRNAVMLLLGIVDHFLRLLKAQHKMYHPIFFIRKRLLKALHGQLLNYRNEEIARIKKMVINFPEPAKIEPIED